METPNRLFVAATATILAACATPYKPESAFNGGGYSEQRRAPGVYAVWFAGNGYTTEDRSEELAVLRAAELCLGEGKPFMHTSDFRTGADSGRFRDGASSDQPAPTSVGHIPGQSLYNMRSGLTVHCLVEKDEDAHEAARVASSIRERYGLAPARRDAGQTKQREQ